MTFLDGVFQKKNGNFSYNFFMLCDRGSSFHTGAIPVLL